jgi:molybdopterin synthase catalytic subunit
MQITVRLFAAHLEAVGASAVALTVPDGASAGDVWDLLVARHPALRPTPRPTVIAVNDEVGPPEHRLEEGDHLALLAPVSGGIVPPGAVRFDLVREPIRLDALLDAVRHPGAGGIVLFLGVVRDHSRGRDVDHLEYEAYETLAHREMARIAAQAAERWGARIAIAHRLGTLAIGDVSVAIAAAAPHRREAFDACRFAIDTLKQTVPIWKKEVWADGAEWIGQDEHSAPTS